MSAIQQLPAAMPRTFPGLEIVEFDEATIVFDDRSRQAHQLLWVSAATFEACREALPTEQLVDELVAAGAGDRDTVIDIVLRSLQSFDSLGLLEDSTPPPPCIGCGTPPRPPRKKLFARS